jgi:hypothetical protein
MKNRDRTIRESCEGTEDKAVLWIENETGQIVDTLPVESRIRPGEGGCQCCYEHLDGWEKHGRVEFDERGLPKLIFGPGEAICADCVEWARLLAYYAENGAVAMPRFEDGTLVLRAGTEELYQIVEARLTGVPSAGVWFRTYTCRRIEIREPEGRIIPACMGLSFELADCELQPIPPRYQLSLPETRGKPAPPRPTDLVGAPARRPEALLQEPPRPRLVSGPRPLLLGKKGGSP